jgi:hypothetical protein
VSGDDGTDSDTQAHAIRSVWVPAVSYPVFMLKPSTYHTHDPGSIVPHIRPKVFTDIQMS